MAGTLLREHREEDADAVNDIAELTLKIDALQATAAAEALDKMDASGKRAAQSAERFTADLKKQADTLGMSNAQLKLYEAQQQKLSATQLASVKNSLNAMAAFEAQAKSVDLLQTALSRLALILAPAALLHAFAEAATHAVHLQSEYVRLSEIAGTTASTLSGFDLPARLAGASLDAVAASIAKLSKSIGEARLNAGGEQASMFRALGINPNDGRDAAELFVDLAKSLLSMKDQTVASTVSMQFLGRGFAEMRPVLKEIVEQGGIHARVTDEQAESAKRLEDAFVKLQFAGETHKVQITNGLIPALEELGAVFGKTEKAASDFTVVGETTGVVLKGITSFAMTAGEALRSVGLTMKGVVQSVNELGHGEFRKAGNVWNEVANDMARHMEETTDKIAQLWDGRAKQTVEAAKEARKAEAEVVSGRSGVSGDSDAETRVKKLMYDKLHYEERINLLKGFAARFADETKLAIQLEEEAYKTAGVDNLNTQEALMVRRQALNELNLRKQVKYLEDQRALSQQQGNLGKVGEANAAIAQVNQQIVANEALTQAQIQTLRAETGRKMQDEYGTETEIENRAYERKLAALNAYLATETNAVVNAQQMREKLQLEHQASLGNLTAQGGLERLKFDQMTWDQQAKTASSSIASVTQTAASSNKHMFQLNKVAAEADIIVSTYQGATKALGQGGFFGFAMAAIITAAGLANLARVRATTFGGGSIAPSVSGSAGGATPVYPVSGSNGGIPSSDKNGGSQIVVNVNVAGHMLGNQDFVDNTLLPAIRDAVDNRDFQIIGVNSRQAANLQP